nr:uncharacterized protein LOC126516492 [Dermacentor andersoni]
MKPTWFYLALLAAVAYVCGNNMPPGCNKVTLSSFAKGTRGLLGSVCKVLHKGSNSTWIGLNPVLKNCTLCCAGKDGDNITYNVTKMPEKLCKKLKNAGKRT